MNAPVISVIRQPGVASVGLSQQRPIGQVRINIGPRGVPGPVGPVGNTGDKGDQGDPGAEGRSAYQSWINQGNAGSEADFLEAIRGPVGHSPYELWLAQGNVGDVSAYLLSIKGDKGDQGDQGVQGVDGRSAYQVWIDAGNVGDVAAYLLAIKGDKGDQGDQGIQGAQGPIGATEAHISEFAPIDIKNLWFNTTTGELQVKLPGGDWVSANAPGPTGPIGPAGADGTAALVAHEAAADPHGQYALAASPKTAITYAAGGTTTVAFDGRCEHYTATVAGGPTTWAVTGFPAGKSAGFILDLTNAGSQTQTWPAGATFEGGVAPTPLTTAGKDRFVWLWDGAELTITLANKDFK